jgi:hypothetical protein
MQTKLTELRLVTQSRKVLTIAILNPHSEPLFYGGLLLPTCGYPILTSRHVFALMVTCNRVTELGLSPLTPPHSQTSRHSKSYR